MNSHVYKTHEPKSGSVQRKALPNRCETESTFHFTDNRPETSIQRKLNEIANEGLQMKQGDQISSTFNSTANGVPQQENLALPDIQLKTIEKSISKNSQSEIKPLTIQKSKISKNAQATFQMGGFGDDKQIVNPVMVQTGLQQIPNLLIHPDYKKTTDTLKVAMAKLNSQHRHIELAMKIQLLQGVMNNGGINSEDFSEVRHLVSSLLKTLQNEHRMAVINYEYERKEAEKRNAN